MCAIDVAYIAVAVIRPLRDPQDQLISGDTAHFADRPASALRRLLSGWAQRGRFAAMPHLDAIGVIVSNMGRSIEFYRLVGLEFAEDADQVHAEATKPGGIRVMLDTEASVMSFSDWQPPTGGGPRTALAFLCESPTDVDRIYETLIEAGGTGHLPPFDAPWGQRYASVHDYDGNAVDLFASES